MQKLTAEDLLNLQYGDRVHKFNGRCMDSYRYVGRMPSSPDRYLIFSEGEKLIHLYIHLDGTYKGDWYNGDFSIEFVDQLELERLEKRIAELRKSMKGQLKQDETLEEAAENYSKITLNRNGLMSDKQVNGFIAGAKWQAERSYNEQEMLNFAWFLIENIGQFSCDRTAHFEGKYLEKFKKK
jgi:hypothetical protein